MKSNIFRAYDIRGIYPGEINEDIAAGIAQATVRFLNAKKIVIGEDARISSPSIRESVIKAITAVGCDVIYIGQCTTPLFYFTSNSIKADGGLMITASHNPSHYNGLKVVRDGTVSIGLESGLAEIEKTVKDTLDRALQSGKITNLDLKNEYIDFLIKTAGSSLGKLKIVIDASNGVTPLVLMPLLERLGWDYTPLYFEIDGLFPNHSSDVSKEEVLADLKSKILEEKADVGVAFDGDGDRIALVDERGQVVRADHILALLFQHKSNFFRRPKVVYDFRFSRSVKELFGIRGAPSRTGHTFVKQVMRRTNADLGGELSGHFFFKEMGYADSAVLTMLNIVKIMEKTGKTLRELVKPFDKYFQSREINIELQDSAGTDIIEMLKDKYNDGKQNFLDGITVEFPDWWFNVRPSNTEPVIRLVVEADTKELMDQKVLELTSEIKNR